MNLAGVTDQMDSSLKGKKNSIHSLFICKIQWRRGGTVLVFYIEVCIMIFLCVLLNA